MRGHRRNRQRSRRSTRSRRGRLRRRPRSGERRCSDRSHRRGRKALSETVPRGETIEERLTGPLLTTGSIELRTCSADDPHRISYGSALESWSDHKVGRIRLSAPTRPPANCQGAPIGSRPRCCRRRRTSAAANDHHPPPRRRSPGARRSRGPKQRAPAAALRSSVGRIIRQATPVGDRCRGTGAAA